MVTDLSGSALRNELLARFPALRHLLPRTLVVGGALRDLLMGREPSDVDLTADDPLVEAERLGERVIVLGRGDLAVFRVATGGRIYDVTPTTPLGRRDFTFNAMALPLGEGELTDEFGGREDLGLKRVRMIAASNFDDDPLRMLKAVRMAVTLGFEIEAATQAAIRARSPRILDVAVERVTAEIAAMFSVAAFRRAVTLLRATGLMPYLFGEVSTPASDGISPAAALAFLVPDPVAAAAKWRWSQELRLEVTSLQGLDAALTSGADLRITLFDVGESVARQAPFLFRAMGREDVASLVETLCSEALFATRALLSGDEIVATAGPLDGREIGRRKRLLLEAQLRGEVTTKNDAERFVRVG